VAGAVAGEGEEDEEDEEDEEKGEDEGAAQRAGWGSWRRERGGHVAPRNLAGGS
jgi:hypothetical protein